MIAFDYIKGNFFRVIHADGVLGGSTPSGNIHMAFFSERQPIPKREVYGLKPDGSLGDLIIDQKVSRHAIVREVDCDVIMSREVAQSLLKWLQQVIDDVKAPSAAREDHSHVA